MTGHHDEDGTEDDCKKCPILCTECKNSSICTACKTEY